MCVCVCGGGVLGGMEVGEREIICLSLHCHHQNDFCIKVGSHFNVSLTVWDKVTRQCPQTTTFEVKGEPKQIRTEDPLLTSPTPYRWDKPAHSPSVQTNSAIYFALSPVVGEQSHRDTERDSILRTSC